jgi:hypothetical protein
VRLQFTVGLNVFRFRRGVVIIVVVFRVFTLCNIFRSDISEELTDDFFRVTE